MHRRRVAQSIVAVQALARPGAVDTPCKTDVTRSRDARASCIAGAATIGGPPHQERRSLVGKFLLGFIVAIIVVLFIVARCVGAIV
jgi:hypothetical protein